MFVSISDCVPLFAIFAMTVVESITVTKLYRVITIFRQLPVIMAAFEICQQQPRSGCLLVRV